MNLQIRATNRIVLGLMLAACLCVSALADTVYVNGTCGNDGWTGASEVCVAPDGPKKTIQAGIDAASDGGAVMVADGVYSGSGNKDLAFQGKQVSLQAVGGSSKCVIDCEGQGKLAQVPVEQVAPITISGFTVKNGNAESGGAIGCIDCVLQIHNCRFESNQSNVGGAIRAYGGSDVKIVSTAFVNNTASAGGGALAAFSCTLRVRDCLFADNYGETASGAVESCLSDTVLMNCAFTSNDSSFLAGAVHACDGARIVQCSFVENAAELGGGLHLNGDGSFIDLCGFALHEGYAIYIDTEGVVLRNSIVWDSAPASTDATESQLTVEYCDFEGGWTGVGNIDADPLFVQPGSSDLRLSFGSPCIDAGSTAALPPDEFDLDGDGDFAEPIPYDAAGNPRVQGTAVDMGHTKANIERCRRRTRRWTLARVR